MNKLTNEQIGYIAGIVDGESNVSIRRIGSHKTKRSSFYCYMSISNTSHELLVYLCNITGLGYVNGPYKQFGDNRKLYWKWHVPQSELLPLLEIVRPLLIVKRKIVSLVFAMRELQSSDWRTTTIEILASREAIYQEAKLVNRRGYTANGENSVDTQNGQYRAEPIKIGTCNGQA